MHCSLPFVGCLLGGRVVGVLKNEKEQSSNVNTSHIACTGVFYQLIFIDFSVSGKSPSEQGQITSTLIIFHLVRYILLILLRILWWQIFFLSVNLNRTFKTKSRNYLCSPSFIFVRQLLPA